MSDIAIRFENVGKLYRLGTVGTGTIAHDIQRWWTTSVLHKEDPYLKIGETNDRSTKGQSDYVYALKDITFDVKQGEVLGIIGKNGAGKSTLLKLLSRVTYPTTGNIYVKGRIASLLEVGTGFHPELTGRENIYMNGSILGMKKYEIDKKFDEIVDFSGCERYLDTPVKRYSSGMMVRLGFAVAAHLEPDILVVDEVLAVGDAEFQKKAIGKMKDVSKGEGRTVLIVSHNMASIKSLCNSGMVLDKGTIDVFGSIDTCINNYLNQNKDKIIKKRIIDSIIYKSPFVDISSIMINNTNNSESRIQFNQTEFSVSIRGYLHHPQKMDMIIILYNNDRIPLASCSKSIYMGTTDKYPSGEFQVNYTIELPEFVGCGDVIVDIRLYEPRVQNLVILENCAHLYIEGSANKFGRPINIKSEGFLGLKCR